jgi:dinuclear metal center YbgI/SA1388 family protein
MRIRETSAKHEEDGMVTVDDLMAFLGDFMGEVGDKDPYMPNGLQVRGREEVKVLSTGVSASLSLFEEAVTRKADALLVHHGMNMPGGMLLDTIFTQRLRFLFEHELSLIAYHYLLDSHPEVGHNVLILRGLGAQPTQPYGEGGCGWYGEFAKPVALDHLEAQCQRMFGQLRASYLFGPSQVRRVVALSGKGAPSPGDMEVLIREGVDLYITGEPHEWNRELFRETGISFFAGGHYNTEKLGVLALGEVIRDRFDLEVEFIDLPNEV